MPNEEKHTLPYAYKTENPKKKSLLSFIAILIYFSAFFSEREKEREEKERDGDYLMS